MAENQKPAFEIIERKLGAISRVCANPNELKKQLEEAQTAADILDAFIGVPRTSSNPDVFFIKVEKRKELLNMT